MLSFDTYFQVINEGGAGGHMAHPFDLPSVINGKKLITVFEKSITHIKKKSAATKIDGTNNSVKIVNSPDGGKEWAMDRGTKGELDIAGITLDKLEQRFPTQLEIDAQSGEVIEKEHGLLKSSQILLGILNSALNDVIPELRKLRMWNNSDIIINTEFVNNGGPNVIKYGKNFIAFHGLVKVKNSIKKHKRTGEPLAVRELIDMTDKHGNHAWDMDAFESLVSKVQNISGQQDFDTHGIIPVRFTGDPDLNKALNQKIEIILTPEQHDTRSLSLWLQSAKNPFNAKITFDNVKRGAMEKKVYQYVIGDNNKSLGPLSEKIDSRDTQVAVDAAIMWHATRLMGREVLSHLETHHNKHIPVGEGIVVRGLKPYTLSHGIPFKIVGDFLVKNLFQGIGA